MKLWKVVNDMEMKIVVNHQQLKENLKKIQEALPVNKPKIFAVVKANAYGHGMVPIANSLENRVDGFAVSFMREAIELIEAGIQQDILVMGPTYAIQEAVQSKVILTLENLEQWEAIEDFFSKVSRPMQYPKLRIHIKLNTNMNRFGFSKESLDVFIEKYKASPYKECIWICGAYSHLAHITKINEKAVQKQKERFLDMKKRIEEVFGAGMMYHLANGENAIDEPSLCFDMIRVGNALYGNVLTKKRIHTVAIAQVLLPLVSVKTVRKGEKIGYGGKIKAKKDMKIGIVEGGFYEGVSLTKETSGQSLFLRYKQWLKQGGRIFLKKENLYYKGQRLSVVGMVNMQYTIVELGNREIRVGEYLEYKKAPLYIKEGVQRIHVMEEDHATN